MNTMKDINRDYLKTLQERAKKSRVYKPYQSTGLALAEILEDQEEYIANMGCSSQIFQATKASFEVSVVGISRKK